jgi:hypothetical protein
MLIEVSMLPKTVAAPTQLMWGYVNHGSGERANDGRATMIEMGYVNRDPDTAENGGRANAVDMDVC